MVALPEREAMEVEHVDEDEKEDKCKTSSDDRGELEHPDAADCEGTAAKESECITKAVSFLPRNKEELERTIKNIQGTITGDILPRLHKCLASTVIILFGAQQVCVNSGVWRAPSDYSSELWIDISFGVFFHLSVFPVHLSSLIIFRFLSCS